MPDSELSQLTTVLKEARTIYRKRAVNAAPRVPVVAGWVGVLLLCFYPSIYVFTNLFGDVLNKTTSTNGQHAPHLFTIRAIVVFVSTVFVDQKGSWKTRWLMVTWFDWSPIPLKWQSLSKCRICEQ